MRRLRRPKLLHTYALFLVLIFGLAGYLYANNGHAEGSGRLVTFHDRGEDQVILTHATTVQGALKDANISVDPHDIVEPSLDTTLDSTDSAVIIYRARPVMVVDGALRQRVVTPGQSPNELATAAGLPAVGSSDKTTLAEDNFIADGAITVLTIERTAVMPVTAPTKLGPTPFALTKGKGAQQYTDSSGVTHRETYYDLPMNIVIGACGPGGYTIRSDGAKVDKNGYILVAANLAVYPRCSVVETSMGLGKVYDTGGFASRYPHGFDLATDWTNYDGR
ncbi:MAG TPA: ubiquitin-like domain-containing protein [Candidatus Bathyarchaeia archaeon]|nr:ubiquitin-like domain-containing protein [Candidatus Bathyarchaeia archaeon]